MEISLTIEIERRVEEVFDFLSDFRNHHQERKSQVLQVEKITPDLSSIGTQYREIVQMIPLFTVEMITAVSRFEPPELIEFTWGGGGMEGELEYHLIPHDGGTKVEFREQITPKGIMKLATPMIRTSFQVTMADRLEGIKRVLEGSDE